MAPQLSDDDLQLLRDPSSSPMKLGGLFLNTPQNNSHVSVQLPLAAPPIPQPPMQLNCIVLGESRSHIFPVDISGEDSVGLLKKKIKQENSRMFNRVDAKDLLLWKISPVFDDAELENLLRTAIFSEKESLSPLDELSKVFPNPPVKGCLHIVVGLPADVGEQEHLFRPTKRARITREAFLQWKTVEECRQFHKDWWGEPGKKLLEDSRLTKVLHIEQPAVRELFGLLELTNGRLYVRDEVTLTYNDLTRAYDCQMNECRESEIKFLRGVLLTGQPGLGKSANIMHIVVKRMSLEQSTLFTTSNDRVYWISRDGVQCCSEPAHSISRDHIKLLNLETNPWSVVDACALGDPPPSQDLFRESLFTIYVTPPNATRYRYWRKHRQPTVYVMQPWDWEDKALLECISLFGSIKMKTNKLWINNIQHTIEDIRYHCGPLPRDIWSYILDAQKFKRDVENAVFEMTADAIHAFLVNLEGLSSSDATLASHKLLIVRRFPRDSNFLRSDEYEVDFISPYVEKELRKRFETLALRDSERLFRACSLVPEASVFGGWIFEAQAMKYTAGQFSDDAVFGPLKLMKAKGRNFTDETLCEGPCRVEKNEHGILTYFNGSSHVLRFTTADFSRPMSGMDDRRPNLFTKREFLHYSEISSVAIHPHCYHVPMQPNNPLFEAFFFDDAIEESNLFIIYVLQMTIAKRHGGSESGLELVKILKRRVEEFVGSQSRVEVRYLLIAPARTYAVSWVMPAEWDDVLYKDVRGDVYIQYLDMKVMKGNCRM